MTTTLPRVSLRLPNRQRGAVLIVSLILLIVMTLLGVSSMNSTSLEEKMAANSQETTRRFQAAETGLSISFNDNSAYDLSGAYNPDAQTVPDTSDTVDTSSAFQGWSPPPAGSLYSATSFQAAHFNFTSAAAVGPDTVITAGALDCGASQCTTLNAGAYQIAPKQN